MNHPYPIFSTLRRFIVALLIIAIATLIRALFSGELGRNTPYLTYYPAVMFAALFGGFIPGLLAIVISSLICFFWILQGSVSPVETLGFSVFIIISIMFLLVVLAMRRAQEKANEISISLNQSQDETQHSQQMMLNALDEQKKVERELKQSENKFRSIFEDSPIGKSMTRVDGSLKTNKAFSEMLGYSFEEFQQKKWRDITHPDDIKKSEEVIESMIRGDITHYEYEKRNLHKNGSVVYTDEQITLQRDDQGNPTYFNTIIIDITDRKKAEIALQMQTERLKSLHIIDQAILQAIESPEEVVQTALEHIRSLLHCQRASVGIFDLDKKDVRIFAADVDGKTIVKTGNILTEEIYGVIEILRQNRIEIVEDMSKVPMPSVTNLILQAEGIQSSINVALISELEMYGVLNVGWENPKSINQEEIDIASEAAIQITIGIEKARLLKETKRYALELEDRVIQRTAQLNAVNDELESFSYSVSHDLRAPLRGIDGFSNILLEDYSDKVGTEGQRLLNVIRDSTKKMGQLIDDLLSFSRIGKREIDKSDVDMKTLAHSIYRELTSDEERIKIEFSISNIPHTDGDPPLLRQLWINIISNAIKFTKYTAHPMIEIGSKKEKGKEWYFIKDNGIGFNMKYYSKLFGVFQRLHSKAEYEGTGIGLSISKRIVNKHGGDIWAESELNVGTTICFTI